MDDPSRKSTAISISGSHCFRWVAFWDRYGNYGGSLELRQTALNAGFGEGVKQGRKDRSARNNSGYQGQGTYQKATKDYSYGLETARCSAATSVRRTSAATPTVTPATSLHHGESDIANTNTMRAIKLIKNAERKVSETRSRIKAAASRDRSSQGVRSWVVEFKKTRRGESLIAFDSFSKIHRHRHESVDPCSWSVDEISAYPKDIASSGLSRAMKMVMSWRSSRAAGDQISL